MPDIITLQPGPTTGKDSYVLDTSPDTNYGTALVAYTGGIYQEPPTPSDIYRTFVAFADLSLFLGRRVVSAILHLDCSANVPADYKPAIIARRVTGTWTQAGVTWNNQPAETSDDEVSVDVTATGWAEWDITDMVDLILQGGATDYGFRLSGVEDGTRTRRTFRTSEYLIDTSLRPKLVLTLPSIVASALLPAEGTRIARQQVALSAQYSGPSAGDLEFQADTVATFDSPDLQTDTAAGIEDGERGEVTLTLAGRGTWYWRVRPVLGAEPSFWVEASLERVPVTIEVVSPADDAETVEGNQDFVFTVETDDGSEAVVTVQIDTVNTFDSPDLVTVDSEEEAAGEITVSYLFALAGVYYWRARATTVEEHAVGEVSPWTATRTLTVMRVIRFRDVNPTWQESRGPLPTHQVVTVIDSSPLVLETAVVDPPPDPEDRIDAWMIRLPAGADDGDALAMATAALAARRARSLYVSGPIPLSVGLPLDCLYRVEWWDRGVLVRSATLPMRKIEHYIEPNRVETVLHFGDAPKPDEALIAELMGRLLRRA